MTFDLVFIVGSPRSGTTLLGDLLDLHPQITNWYEPYFVYDRYFLHKTNDCRTRTDATAEITTFLRNEVTYVQRHRKGQVITDKSPRNSLKIPFLREVYPDAKFIHILRDGRDATLSIRKEWHKWSQLLRESTSPVDRFKSFVTYVNRQPLWRHKAAAARFQVGGLPNLLRNPKAVSQAGRRWGNRAGWGPQFEGWEKIIDQVSLLQFNAMQWTECVASILASKTGIATDQFFELRYEDFIQRPEACLQEIFHFMGVSPIKNLSEQLPPIVSGNSQKWMQEFTGEELTEIGPILNPLLLRLGYSDNGDWYQAGEAKLS